MVLLFALSTDTQYSQLLLATVLLWNLGWLWYTRSVARPGDLCFDGVRWTWREGSTPTAQECSVLVTMDFNRFLVLRVVTPENRVCRWLWLRQTEQTKWIVLRALLWLAPLK